MRIKRDEGHWDWTPSAILQHSGELFITQRGPTVSNQTARKIPTALDQGMFRLLSRVTFFFIVAAEVSNI